MNDIWSRTQYYMEQSLDIESLEHLDTLARGQRFTKDKSKYCCFMPIYRKNLICQNCGCYDLWNTSLGQEYMNRVNTLKESVCH